MDRFKERLRLLDLNVKDYIFIMVSLIILLYRLTLHGDNFDEIINLNSAYRISIGQIPFVECWEGFQSANILVAPLIWLFVKIVGSTGGIILFIRFCNFLLLLIVSVTIFNALKKIVKGKTAFYISFIALFFQIHGLYYLWYDTISISFLTISLFLLYDCFDSEKFKFKAYLVGFSLAITAFAYPSYLLLVGFIMLSLCVKYVLSNRNIEEKKDRDIIGYITLGGGSFCLVIILYFLSVSSINELMHFITTYVLPFKSADSGQSKTLLVDVIYSFIKLNKFLLVPTCFLICVYFKSIVSSKYVKWLVMGILIFSFLNMFLVTSRYRGLNNFLGYLGLWAPFLYYLNSQRGKSDELLLIYIWLPSILTSILIATTSAYTQDVGPLKSWEAFLPAAIVTILYMNKLVDFRISNVIPKFVIGTLLINFSTFVYLDQPHIILNDKRADWGIYKGIKLNSQMANFQDIQNYVRDMTWQKNTILVSSNLRPIYLMTSLRPCTPSIASPNYYINKESIWDRTLDYFKIYDYPEILILNGNDLVDPAISSMLQEKFNFVEKKIIGPYELNVLYRNY